MNHTAMNRLLTPTLLATAFVLVAPSLHAQVLPDLGNVVQGVTERQAERAQNQAVERAVQQAEAAQSRATERAETRQADNVQNQVVDRVENQVERAQSQAAERAQAEVERVQTQVDRAEDRLQQVQTRAVEQVQRLPELPQQTAERVRAAVPTRAEAAIAAGAVVEAPADLPEPATRGVAAATADDDTAAPPPLPERQNVADSNGNAAFVEITIEPGVRVIEFEWVMLVTPAERQQLDTQAADLMAFLTDTDAFGLADGELLTFSVPPDLDANDAILQLVPEDMRDLIDRNHVYTEQADTAGLPAVEPLPLPMQAACTAPVAIGIIDSAMDTSHAAFAHLNRTQLQLRSFVDAALVQPAAHGTAVASVLVGSNDNTATEAALRPLLPNATLYSAAVFHAGEGTGQGATAQRVLQALDWLVSEDAVQVINVSLAGPPNRLLAQAIMLAQQQGKVIVAAVGNEGAHGPVRYPAAYDGVVGVTAVSRDGSVFRWANQGAQVDFAALGVAVPVALGDGGFGPESGTSIASPVVAAMTACVLAQNADVTAALTTLQHQAFDLGTSGADTVFGNGLLHP